MALQIRKIHLTLLLPFFLTIQLYGQLKVDEVYAPQSDLKVWTGINLSKSVTENLNFVVKTSYFTKNMTYAPRFSDVGMNYNLYKNMKVAAFYRFSNYFRTDEKQIYVELSDNISLKSLGKGIVIMPRLRWQQKQDPETLVKKRHLRPQIVIKSQFLETPIQPFIASELFLTTGDATLDKYRVTFGFDYSVNENYSLGVFFRHDKERFADKHETDKHNTFNLSYQFRF